MESKVNFGKTPFTYPVPEGCCTHEAVESPVPRGYRIIFSRHNKEGRLKAYGEIDVRGMKDARPLPDDDPIWETAGGDVLTMKIMDRL